MLTAVEELKPSLKTPFPNPYEYYTDKYVSEEDHVSEKSDSDESTSSE